MIRISQVKDDVGICSGCGKVFGIFFRAEMGGADEKYCLNLCKSCLGKFVKGGQEQLTIRNKEAREEQKTCMQKDFIRDGYRKNRGPREEKRT